MPRTERVDVGDVVYHVINRANARAQIFHDDSDYLLFEELLKSAKEEVVDMRILSYCIMPNHWHLVLMPRKDGDLQQFMHWLQVTHTRRWHTGQKTIGSGHLYQGRYKSFPVETDSYLISLLGYVERNPLRAKMVKRAEDWRWSSLWIREKGTQKQKKLLEEWPIDMPDNYLEYVNEPQPEKELDDVHLCIKKNRPFGSSGWTEEMCAKFNLESTMREPGRPKRK